MAPFLADMTSSKTGTFYFAFGSNLSPEQMSIRCTHSNSSSTPVAIARLDGWKWIICERGYANMVKMPQDTGSSISEQPIVWGVVYNMTAQDELILDRYEGCDDWRNPRPQRNPDSETARRKPFLQGDWDYGKQYLLVTVAKWLEKPTNFGVEEDCSTITVLAYVDELRTREGRIHHAYIGRMNRGIRQSIALGVPEDWIEQTMRRWVTKGVESAPGYVGTDAGYASDEDP